MTSKLPQHLQPLAVPRSEGKRVEQVTTGLRRIRGLPKLRELEMRLRRGAGIENEHAFPSLNGLRRLFQCRIRLGEGFLRCDEKWIQSGDASRIRQNIVPALFPQIELDEAQEGALEEPAAMHRNTAISSSSRFISRSAIT